MSIRALAWMQLTGCLVCSSGCYVYFALGEPRPTASVSLEANPVLRGRPVTVYGTQSATFGERPPNYQWTMTSAPAGSKAALVNATSRDATFTPDLNGTYRMNLVVGDGRNFSDPAELSVTAINARPVADAGPDLAAELGVGVMPLGSGWDPNGDPVTSQWTITENPPGSASTLVNADTSRPTLTPDVEGAFTLSLTVNDGAEASAPDTVTVVAYRPIQRLGFKVIDAEYSASLNRLVLTSTSPNALHVYDPVSASEVAVPLTLVPTALSVSPDGRFAVVGHNAFISYVNLESGAVVGSPIALPIDVGAVALSGSRAYAFTKSSWAKIQTVVLSTRAVSTSTQDVYNGFEVRLHPTGSALYAGSLGVSPGDFHKMILAANGTAQVGYDSQYHGGDAMGGEFWFSSTGDRLFGSGGTVFTLNPAATNNSTDIIYTGTLTDFGDYSYGWLASMSYSATKNELAVIPMRYTQTEAMNDRQLRLYSADLYQLTRTIPLTRFVVGGTSHAAHGRFVFHRSDSSKRYVVVQADPSAALTNDYGVVVY